MSPTNVGAFLEGAKVRPLGVREAPYSPPGAGEIVVKTAAVALNPLEYIKQSLGNFLYSHVKYPFIMGSDVAGVVVEVGSDVSRFKVGDRVVGHTLGMEKKHNKSSMGGFQLYPVLLAKMASPVPESIPLARAVVIPLGLSTAACGLFQKDQLALRHPSPGHSRQEAQGPAREILLIWGGSSSVGCNAIQLATAAGYDVITTCSPKNFELVKSLGAKATFDYKSKTVVEELVRECQGRTVAGAMSIGDGAAEGCVDVLGACEGRRFLSMVSYPNPPDPEAGVPARILFFMRWTASMWLRTASKGVKTKFVWGASLEDNEVGKLVYEDFLPQALREGAFVPAPSPRVVGTGLGAIQDGLDMLKGGVSACKLVVVLDGEESKGIN